MSGPIASPRARSERIRRFAPGIAVVLVALLAGLSAGATVIVMRHFTTEAVTMSRLYAEVYEGLTDEEPTAATTSLLALGVQVRQLGMPLVLTDPSGRVIEAANLPFEAELTDPRVRAYADELDRINPPIQMKSVGNVLHYGATPNARLLLSLGALQALTILVMVAVGVVAYRNATAAQRDRLWVAMAREAAHQMGTPLTSLQGWIEQVRGGGVPPDRLADLLDADAERLHRVAQRFERIGNPARREPVGLGALAERVAGYYRNRLPTRANPISLTVRAPSSGPIVLGDPVLLEWALEAMVKNAIDALQGRGGTIVLQALIVGDDALLRVTDDGPGVPRDLRRAVFEPGITTKRGGWGIGLALARRVVEDGHDGALTLEPIETGTVFLMRFPLAAPTA